MDPREHWQAMYEAKRPDEVSWYQPVPEPSLEALERLGIGSDAAFIDVGGGASGLARVLAGRGWQDVTVLDIAGSALAEAKHRLADMGETVRWIEADLLNWRPDRRYDVWHDRAVLHFLTRAGERARYVDALKAGTQTGSVVIIAAFAMDGPEQCSGLPVRRYNAETLAAELGPDFAPIESWRQAHVTPWGATQNFQWATFSRR